MAIAVTFAKAGPVGNDSVRPSLANRLLTPDEVAQMLGLSIDTLAQWRSQRRGIPFVKLSRSVVRYRQRDLEAWLDERIVRVEVERPNASGRR